MTLNKTWQLCLKMWKWIIEEIKRDKTQSIEGLKEKWLIKNKYENIFCDCFFCNYAYQQPLKDCEDMCDFCPGRLVSKRFNCFDSSYNHETKPLKFYKKLIQLNNKRRKICH